jgi:hypothetical protein
MIFAVHRLHRASRLAPRLLGRLLLLGAELLHRLDDYLRIVKKVIVNTPVEFIVWHALGDSRSPIVRAGAGAEDKPSGSQSDKGKKKQTPADDFPAWL